MTIPYVASIKIKGPAVVFLRHGIAAPSLLRKIVLVVSGK
jgi:hypothetical protein